MEVVVGTLYLVCGDFIKRKYNGERHGTERFSENVTTCFSAKDLRYLTREVPHRWDKCKDNIGLVFHNVRNPSSQHFSNETITHNERSHEI